jgi:DNA-binding response OmpR family regulator
VLDVITRLDGIEPCARLRTLDRQRAVLMIKARGAIRDRLLRLDAVADDSASSCSPTTN